MAEENGADATEVKTEVNNANADQAEDGAANATPAYIGQTPSFDHVAKDDFEFFRSRLMNFFTANDIVSDDRRKAILISSLADKSCKLLKGLCLPDSPDNIEFDALLDKLAEYFKPRDVKPFFGARLSFYTAFKKRDESYEDWAKRVETLAAECGFADGTERVIKDIFVIGLGYNTVRSRLLEEDPTSSDVTLESLIALANQTEALQNAMDSKTEKVKCNVCGMFNHAAGDCKYKGSKCDNCGKEGHIAPGCPERVKLRSRHRQAMKRYAQSAAQRYMQGSGGRGGRQGGGMRAGPRNYGGPYGRPYY